MRKMTVSAYLSWNSGVSCAPQARAISATASASRRAHAASGEANSELDACNQPHWSLQNSSSFEHAWKTLYGIAIQKSSPDRSMHSVPEDLAAGILTLTAFAVLTSSIVWLMPYWT